MAGTRVVRRKRLSLRANVILVDALLSVPGVPWKGVFAENAQHMDMLGTARICCANPPPA